MKVQHVLQKIHVHLAHVDALEREIKRNARLIVDYRQARGIGVRILAKELHVSTSHIRAYEKGRRVGCAVLRRIAKLHEGISRI